MKLNMVVKAVNRYDDVGVPVIDAGKEHYSKIVEPKYEQIKIPKSKMSNRDKLLMNILRREKQTCPYGHLHCEHYETCCFTKQRYTCCPLYSAVCCEDKCCSAGSSCSSGGMVFIHYFK